MFSTRLNLLFRVISWKLRSHKSSLVNIGKSGLIIIGAKEYRLNYFSRFYGSQSLITLYTSSPAFAFIVSQFQYLLYIPYMQQRNASMYNIYNDRQII